MNKKYERFMNDYNKPHKNCGTCGHYGERGCDIRTNIFVIEKD
jgi:hypothetical protein